MKNVESPNNKHQEKNHTSNNMTQNILSFHKQSVMKQKIYEKYFYKQWYRYQSWYNLQKTIVNHNKVITIPNTNKMEKHKVKKWCWCGSNYHLKITFKYPPLAIYTEKIRTLDLEMGLYKSKENKKGKNQ